MRNKKLISWISAAAMTASAFVPFANIASAETETLWSDTFDSYVNEVSEVTNDDNTYSVPGSLGFDSVLAWGILQKIDYPVTGATLSTVNRGDDSSYLIIKEKEGDPADKYLETTVARFSTKGEKNDVDRGARITFDKAFEPADGKDLVLAFDAMLTPATGTSNSGNELRSAFVVGAQNDGIEVSADIEGVEASTWESYKVVVNEEGSTLYLKEGDAYVDTGVTSDVITIDAIRVVDRNIENTANVKMDDTHPVGYPTVAFDNIVVYNADDGVADPVPGASAGEVVTPAPTVAPEKAPEFTAPEGATVIGEHSFDDATAERLMMIGPEQDDYTAFAGMNLNIGTRSQANGSTNWSVQAVAEGGNVLAANMYEYSNGNRTPQLMMNTTTDGLEDGGQLVAQYAVKLIPNEANGIPAEVVFSYDYGADGKYNLRSPIAYITTDAEADTSAVGPDGTAEAIEVAANEWIPVTMTIDSDNNLIITVDDQELYNGVVTVDEDGVLGGSNEVNRLPYISFRSGNTDTYAVSNSTVQFDNVVIYTIGAGATIPTAAPATDAPATEPPATAEPTVPGDVLGDGSVTAEDAEAVIASLIGTEGAAAIDEAAADVNGDGVVNALDANYIAQFAMGELTDFEEVKKVTAAEAAVQTVNLAATENDPTMSAKLVGEAPSKAGETATFDIYIGNIPAGEQIKTIQFNLPTDTDLYDVTVANTAENMSLAFVGQTNVVEGEARYVFVAMGENQYVTLAEGEEAKIATVTLTLKTDLAEGEYSFPYANAIINTQSDDVVLIEYRLDNDKLYLEAPSFTVEGSEPVVTEAPAVTAEPDPDFGEGKPAMTAKLVGEAPAKAGDTATFEIYIGNIPVGEQIKTIQFNLPTDTDLYDVTVANTAENMSLAFVGQTNVVEGEARYVFVAMGENQYVTLAEGEEAEIATVTLTLKSDLAEGEYSFPYANAIINTQSDDVVLIEYRLDARNIDLAYPRFTVGAVEPTTAPTDEPTTTPTDEPTTAPTAEPTTVPTDEPTTAPSDEPTAEPTTAPTDEPTTAPTAEPTAAPGQAPTFTVPEGATVIGVHSFDDVAAERLMMLGPDQADYTAFAGMNLNIGTRSSANGATNWSVQTVAEGGNVLAANMYDYSNGNRTPKLMMNTTTEALAEGGQLVAQYAVKLIPNETNGIPAEVIFSYDYSVDGKYELRSPIAYITTDADAQTSAAGPDGTAVAMEVAANEWIPVTMVINSDNELTITVGSDELYSGVVTVDEDGVLDAAGTTVMNRMPYISFRSGNADTYAASNSTVQFDNVTIYSVGADVPVITPTPSDEPTTAPTTAPSDEPTAEPTTAPTEAPSVSKPITEIVTDETVNLITDTAKVEFTVTAGETEVAYGDGWVVVDSEGNELTADEVAALETTGSDASYVKGLSVKVFGDTAVTVAAAITGRTTTSVGADVVDPITLDADALTFTGLKDDKKITSFSIEIPGDVRDSLTVTVEGCQVGYNAELNKTIIIFVAMSADEYIEVTDGTLVIGSYTGATAPVYVTVTYETAEGEAWLDNEYLYTGTAATDKIIVEKDATVGGETDVDPTPATEEPTEPSTAPSGEPTTEPTTAPSGEPTTEPTTAPSGEPTATPTASPTATPTTVRPGGGSGGSGGGGTGGGTTTTITNPSNPVIGGTQAFPLKLNDGQLTDGAAAIYASSKTSNNTFTVNVLINGANTTLFEGFDPLMVKVPYSVASSNTYDVVVRDSAGNIVTRSYLDNNTMYVALDNASGTFTIVELPAATFSDVNHPWATEAISALANRNIIDGVGDGLYDPDAGVTRAQIVKMIVEMYDLDLVDGSEATFSDVSADAWYATYVATAEKYAITNGMGDGTFGPDDYITREQMATMLYRANDVLHVTMSSTAATVTYADDASISDWAKAAVYRMQQADMMSGIGDNMFDPTAVSTRAQAAAAIYKVFTASMTNATTWGF